MGVLLTPIIMPVKGVVVLKKIYRKPLLEELTFCLDEAIAVDPDSFPYNDGELGWT